MAELPTPPPDKSMTTSMSEGEDLNSGSSNHNSLPEQFFGNRYRRKDNVDSFAERHVRLARQTSEELLWAGRKLLEGVQGSVSFTPYFQVRW